MTSAERMFTSRRISVAPGVRAAVERRCGAACESCGLAWPWALDLFRVSEDGRNTAANLIALCPRCSEDRAGPCTPLVAHHGLRERMRFANNRRAAVHPLTPARRRTLIASRGGCCEICGISGSLRTLEVHHILAVLQGGHDGEDNLQVLCFACHRQVQPCLTGCGAWAKKPRQLCRHCLTRKRLEDLMPEATWEEIKARYPTFVAEWKPGYEPNALPRPNHDRQASDVPWRAVVDHVDRVDGTGLGPAGFSGTHI